MNRIAIPLIGIVFCLSCSRVIYPVNQVGVVSEQSGTLTLRSTGYGRQKVEALDAAQTNALEALLFRGVPGTQYGSPLIDADDAESQSNNHSYLNYLLESSKSKSFITSSIPVSDYNRTEYNAWSITVDVTINVVALRKDLEQHGIIRKFGF